MRVVLVGYPNCCALDLVGPSDVFVTANQLTGETQYESVVASTSAGPFVTESGLQIVAETDVRSASRGAHTLLVGGGLGFPAACADEELIQSIRDAAVDRPRIVSVCTGSFLLAAAGLLDGRRATTHWAFAAQLAATHPAIDVVDDELYVSDGHVITAAGVASGIDLALAIVAGDHGIELARSISRRMVVYLNRTGGQSQFSERTVAPDSIDPSIARVLTLIIADPLADHSLASMAAAACMSTRHFGRLFRRETGTTPARWVERVRVDTARGLFETTDLDPHQVAERSGFGSYHTMRQAFQRVVGMSPSQYRTLH